MEMRRTAVLFPLLTLLVIAFTPNTFAQTYLQFLELGSYGVNSTIVPRADDGASNTITITGFPVGSSTYNSAYVSTNGLISLGQRLTSPSAPSSFSTTSFHVIAPFWADAITTSRGSIFYEVHSSAAGSSSLIPLNTVSTFIRNVDGGTFSGTWMLAAEWYQVPQFGQSTSSGTNTFQAILITDGSTSYSVFTYLCGSMQWGTSGVGIGFRADNSYYRDHPLSRSANASAIACLNAPTNEWSNVVYKLTSGVNCLATQFGCNNGRCVTSSDRCDNFNDCRDNSDEAACLPTTTYVGFEDTSYTVNEGATTRSLQVCLTIKSGPPLSSLATVTVTSSSGSAQAGSDFSSVSRTVLFQSGSAQGTQQCFTVTIFSDNTFELTETFTLRLSNPSISYLEIQSLTQSTTVYILNTVTTCSFSQFTCTNLQCVFQSDRCDGFNDCSDNSDEIGCASSGANIGLAVGLSVPAFIVFMFILIPCCFGISWYRRQNQFRSIPVTVNASSPSTNPTIITTTTTATEGVASAPPTWGCELGARAHEPPPVYPGVGHDPYNVQQQYPYTYEGQQQNPPPYSGYPPTPSYPPQEQYTYPAPVSYPVEQTGDGYPPPTYPTNHVL